MRPPPRASAPGSPASSASCVVRVTPPVIVRSSIVTTGDVAAPNSPTWITGPPPSIVVLETPDPRSVMLASTITPPAYVPSASETVSPSFAACSAGASSEKAQPLSHTSIVSAPLRGEDPAVGPVQAARAMATPLTAARKGMCFGRIGSVSFRPSPRPSRRR